MQYEATVRKGCAGLVQLFGESYLLQRLPASVLWLLVVVVLTTLISGPQIVYRSSQGLVPSLGATHESKCLLPGV